MSDRMTNAEALNSFWAELNSDIPVEARNQMLIDASRELNISAGLCVKEPTNV